MSISVFSDFSNNIPNANNYTAKPQQKVDTAKTEVKIDDKNVKTGSEKTNELTKKEKFIKTAKTIAPIAIPLIAIPITAGITYKIANKNSNALKNQIKNLSNEIEGLKEQGLEQIKGLNGNIQAQATNIEKENSKIWSAILAVAGLGGAYKTGQLTSEDKDEITKTLSERATNLDNKTNYAVESANRALVENGGSLSRKYAKNLYGIPLLINNDSISKNSQKYDLAVKKIQTAAPKHLYNAPDVKPIDKENPVLWSITSEFAPVKEGGLGSVPVEIQNNSVKLGVKMPAFIPMYQQKGVASFREDNGEYIYSYKGKEFKLDKAASFTIDSYQNGKSRPEKVEIYVSNTKDNEGNDKQLVFVKNNHYFNGTIYQGTEKSEEPEKFAFFSKAVYEFAKAKEDLTSVKNLRIDNRDAFNSIESPDGLVLNDWQASPIAALARYKAPMENAYGQLSDAAASKLSDMRIITIGHNAKYQGSTRDNNDNFQRNQATSNILNTLFDDFTYDIVKNAKTNAIEQNPEDKGLNNLENVLVINPNDMNSNHTNLLNMGICLSDYFHPVSQNYAQEIISDEHPELAGELRWALNQKNNAGSLVGIINGNDFNNLSIEAKKANIKNMTGLDFQTYNKQSTIEDVMHARENNKINFYNNYMKLFSKKNDATINDENMNNIRQLSNRLESVGNTSLPELSDDELKETPIFSFVGRLVSQKGVKIMSDAIDMLMKNWEKDFPGKQKPIFYIAGQDGEGGVQRKHIEELKDKKLSKEDSNRVIFAHGFAPMSAITAASDLFLIPSIFEPCGLVQGESFAVATPVVGSAVGGIVDTVNRDGKTNGILTDKSKKLTAESFYNAMKESLNIYFNDKEQYNKMVADSLAEDFSWVQKGKKGPEFDYLDAIGISRESRPEIFKD